MKRAVSVALIAIGLLVCGFRAEVSGQKKKKPKFKLPESVELVRDVVYGRGGDRPLKLHIVRPKNPPKAPMPVLVWIHGGGWRGGNKESGIGRLARFADKGYFCATIEYRLSNEAIFPAQIQDCKCAIRFLRAHAKKYHLDPKRIGVWGSSAGGHLVALLGTSGDIKELEGSGGWPDRSSRVQAVCDFCGPTDLIAIYDKTPIATVAVKGLLGGAAKEKAKLAKLGSPITHVSKDDAPILIVHGTKDKLVPLNQAKILHDALKKAGVQSTLYVAEGFGHGLGGPKIIGKVEEFFDKTLKND